MSIHRTKVIYIAGATRSGSTLLGNLIGQHNHVASVGELKYIWDRGLKENHVCGCGKNFSDCTLWSSITRDTLSIADRKSVEYYHMLSRKVDRIRYIPLLLSHFRSPRFNKRLDEYKQLLSSIFEKIELQTGAEFVLDTSKDPWTLQILKEIPSIELFVIHLVRDPRAVAYSNTRKKIRPGITNRDEYLPQLSTIRSNLEWVFRNGMLEIMQGGFEHYVRIQYESFVNEFPNSIFGIWNDLGLPNQAFDITSAATNTIALKNVNHTISGNPVRFDRDKVKIELDRDWINDFPRLRKVISSIISSPLLFYYHYPLMS